MFPYFRLSLISISLVFISCASAYSTHILEPSANGVQGEDVYVKSAVTVQESGTLVKLPCLGCPWRHADDLQDNDQEVSATTTALLLNFKTAATGEQLFLNDLLFEAIYQHRTSRQSTFPSLISYAGTYQPTANQVVEATTGTAHSAPNSSTGMHPAPLQPLQGVGWLLSYKQTFIDAATCCDDTTGLALCLRLDITHITLPDISRTISLDAAGQPSIHIGLRRHFNGTLQPVRDACLVQDRMSLPEALPHTPMTVHKAYERPGIYSSPIYRYITAKLQSIYDSIEATRWQVVSMAMGVCSLVFVVVRLAKRRYDRDAARTGKCVADFPRCDDQARADGDKLEEGVLENCDMPLRSRPPCLSV